jgi:hypothetical protein
MEAVMQAAKTGGPPLPGKGRLFWIKIPPSLLLTQRADLLKDSP